MREWWNRMSTAGKWLVSVAAGVITVGGSFATLGGGLDQVDGFIETEAEHNADIELLLEQLTLQNQQLIQQNERIDRAIENENQREKNDRIQRNMREIRRLNKEMRQETDPAEKANIELDIKEYELEIACIRHDEC